MNGDGEWNEVTPLLASKKGTESASPGTTISHEYWVRRNLSAELAGVIRYALKSAENTESGRFSEKPETNGAVWFSKPSKALPHFAELLIEPVHKHPDTSTYRVISGAIPDTTKILELLNQWSHLFYTGNELGWKSPVVVDATFDREFAAKHYMFPEKNKMSSIEDLKRPTIPSSLNGVLHDAHYGDIINNFHFKHMSAMLDHSQGESIDENDSLLQEEIPGALLPIAAVDSLDEAIGSIDAGLDQVQYEPLTTATGRVRKDADARDTIVWLRLLE
ncbi:hypothetical protein BKA83DRAFT_4122524 [Pisolithus microcarpus]|nr:hypothetical protein BKA83DRAFT_4122524 [Pisolithus microcarpus]